MHKNNTIRLPYHTGLWWLHKSTNIRCLLIYFILFLSLHLKMHSILEIQPIFMKADVVANCKFHSFEIIPCDAQFSIFKCFVSTFFLFHNFDSIFILLVERRKEIKKLIVECWIPIIIIFLQTPFFFLFIIIPKKKTFIIILVIDINKRKQTIFKLFDLIYEIKYYI